MATEKKSPAAAKKAPATRKTAAPAATRTRKAPQILLEDGTLQSVGAQVKIGHRLTTKNKKDGRIRIPAETIDFVRIHAKQLGGDMSQPELAKAIGCSQPTISYIVRGKIRNS